MIRWKIFYAMSAFTESEIFLKEQILNVSNDSLRLEIERSFSLINAKKNRK
jgi:hypothetical protein